MNRKKRNTRNNQLKKKSVIVRCRTHSKPVFEHEVCSSFSSKNSSNGQENCENCLHSF
jgi:hypothetical protein